MKKLFLLSLSLGSMVLQAQTPIYHFPFDNSISTVDASITLNNAGTTASFTSDRNGTANGAIQFSNTNYLWSTGLTNLPSGSNPFTVSFWVKYNAASTNTMLYYGTNLNNQALSIRESVQNSTTVTSNFITGSGGTIFLSHTANHYTLANQWYHYTVCYTPIVGSSAGSLKIYRDGILIRNEPAGNRNITLNDFSIGAIPGSSNAQMNGALDDLKIFNSALTDAQVTALYNSGSQPVVTAPTINAVSTSAITAFSAVVNFGISANGANATTVIRYGTAANALTQTYNCPSTTSSSVFNETLTGLTASTTYYYQIESSNSAGTTTTPTVYSFTTTADPNVITNGLIAYYSFDNFNSHNGLHNLTPSVSAPILDAVGGKVGLGARFESTSQQELINSTSLNSAIDGTEFTICYWVNSQAQATALGFPTHFEMFGSGFIRQNQSNGYGALNHGYATSASVFRTGGGAVSNLNGTWKHIAVVHKSGTINNKEFYVYVNGVLQAGFAPIANVPQLYKFNSNFVIGGGGMASKYFKGYIDEFYIYNRALEQTEIAAVRDNTTAPALSINDIEGIAQPKLYPNPAVDWIHVETVQNLKLVEFFTVQGQKVLESNQTVIDVSTLLPGIYIVKMQEKEGTITVQKLFKK